MACPKCEPSFGQTFERLRLWISWRSSAPVHRPPFSISALTQLTIEPAATHEWTTKPQIWPNQLRPTSAQILAAMHRTLAWVPPWGGSDHVWAELGRTWVDVAKTRAESPETWVAGASPLDWCYATWESASTMRLASALRALASRPITTAALTPPRCSWRHRRNGFPQRHRRNLERPPPPPPTATRPCSRAPGAPVRALHRPRSVAENRGPDAHLRGTRAASRTRKGWEGGRLHRQQLVPVEPLQTFRDLCARAGRREAHPP